MIVGLDPFPPDEPVDVFHRNGRLIDLNRAARLRAVELDWPQRLDVTFDIDGRYVSPEFMLVADAVVLSFRGLQQVRLQETQPDYEDNRGRLRNFVHAPEGEASTLFDIEIVGLDIAVVARDLHVDVEGERGAGPDAATAT